MTRVRQARLEAKIGLRELSEKTGYDLSTCSAWETGEHIPSMAKFVDICSAVGLKVVLVSA